VTVGSSAPLTRRLAVAVAVTAAAFGALLGWVLAAHGHPLAWDLGLHAAAVEHRTDPLTAAARGVSAANEVVAYVVAPIGGLLALRPRPWWLGALTGAAALAAGQWLRFGLSVAVARPRPPRSDWAGPASGYAFPSGHTTTATLAAGLLCLGAVRVLHGARRVVVLVVAAAWAAVVGLSRVYLGVHWPTDVLGGWLLGLLLTALLACSLVPRGGQANQAMQKMPATRQ
jgi:membrane-associated phospholipid phosphatase